MGNKNFPPNPQEEPDEAYRQAYAERYGLELPTPPEVEPQPAEVAPDQSIDALERTEAYQRRIRAVEGAQKAVDEAETRDQKRRATLRLEEAQRQFEDFRAQRGTPDEAPTFGEEKAPTVEPDTPGGWANIMEIPSDMKELLDLQAQLYNEADSTERNTFLARVNARIEELSSGA